MVFVTKILVLRYHEDKSESSRQAKAIVKRKQLNGMVNCQYIYIYNVTYKCLSTQISLTNIIIIV